MFQRHFLHGLLVVSGSFATHALLSLSFGDAPQGISTSIATSLGCRTSGIKSINKANPEWVHVQSEEPTLMEGRVLESKVSYEEFPFNHDSHDVNWMVSPDPAYRNMLTEKAELTDGTPVMECELETKYFPMNMWPVEGDRTWTLGRFVMDCGHPEHYRTEIHPPVASVFSRLDPFIFQSEPAPSFTNVTRIFLGGNGGYFTYRVGGRDYEFDVPFPAKPSAGAAPRFQVLSTTPGMPAPILSLKSSPTTKSPAATTGRIPRSGAAIPPGGLVATTGIEPAPKLHVKIPFGNLPDSNPPFWNLYDYIARGPTRQGNVAFWPPIDRPKNNRSYSAIVVQGWKEPTLSKGYRQIRVIFDNIKIHHDHDPLASGEWNLYVRANGRWGKIPGTGDVDDGDTVRAQNSALFFVPEDGAVSIQACGWEDDNDGHFRVGPMPDITDITALDENAELGKVKEVFRADSNFGIGSHSTKSTQGDYTLNYTIQEAARYNAGASNTPTRVTVAIQSIKVHDSKATTTSLPLRFGFLLGASGKAYPATGTTNIRLDRIVPVALSVSALLTGNLPLKFSASTTLPGVQISGVPKPGNSDVDVQDRDLRFERTFSAANNYGQGQHTDRAAIVGGSMEVTYSVTVAKDTGLTVKPGVLQPLKPPVRRGRGGT